MSEPPVDPVALTSDLIRCRSVTPQEGGALTLLRELLESAGFRCVRTDRGNVPNLFARFDGPPGKPVFGFNGHTDVVPPGDHMDWTHDPYCGSVLDGWVWGRGAADMKSGVAAFSAAAIDFVRQRPDAGSVILAVTGDEEGPATDGTIAILDWMNANGEKMDACVVGEPTCPEVPGQMMKIGRRGSMSVIFRASGKQGHSAYPERARNPVSAIVSLCHRLCQEGFDEGSENFAPTTLAVTTIDTGNTAGNIIPAHCSAAVNIRFNDLHSSAVLTEWLRHQACQTEDRFGVTIAMETVLAGESFLTPPGPLSSLVADAVEKETGRRPELSTSGGTSDARFIKDCCPVVEFGLVGATMHQVDERVRTDDINQLKAIYLRILDGFFA